MKHIFTKVITYAMYTLRESILYLALFVTNIFSAQALSFYANDSVRVFMPEPVASLNFSVEPRIINGFEAYPHDYPHQVGIEILVSGGWTWCGGSIISENFILTAAHCIDQAYYVYIQFGAHDRMNPSEPGKIRMMVSNTNFIVHRYWDPSALVNDIALIRLPSPITYTRNIRAIALPNRNYIYNTFEGNPAKTSGWGYYRQTSGLSRNLQFADVIIMNLDRCRSYLRQVTNTHICIDGSYGNGVCYGDSGSSVVSTAGHRVLLGVTSFVSAAGCEINYPSVYTRVTSFLDWIQQNTGIMILG